MLTKTIKLFLSMFSLTMAFSVDILLRKMLIFWSCTYFELNTLVFLLENQFKSFIKTLNRYKVSGGKRFPFGTWNLKIWLCLLENWIMYRKIFIGFFLFLIEKIFAAIYLEIMLSYFFHANFLTLADVETFF